MIAATATPMTIPTMAPVPRPPSASPVLAPNVGAGGEAVVVVVVVAENVVIVLYYDSVCFCPVQVQKCFYQLCQILEFSRNYTKLPMLAIKAYVGSIRTGGNYFC